MANSVLETTECLVLKNFRDCRCSGALSQCMHGNRAHNEIVTLSALRAQGGSAVMKRSHAGCRVLSGYCGIFVGHVLVICSIYLCGIYQSTLPVSVF